MSYSLSTTSQTGADVFSKCSRLGPLHLTAHPRHIRLNFGQNLSRSVVRSEGESRVV